ncbi:MAG: hypothetical protein QXD25_01825 [Nanopusillaceae archaeon]
MQELKLILITNLLLSTKNIIVRNASYRTTGAPPIHEFTFYVSQEPDISYVNSVIKPIYDDIYTASGYDLIFIEVG